MSVALCGGRGGHEPGPSRGDRRWGADHGADGESLRADRSLWAAETNDEDTSTARFLCPARADSGVQ